jgi:methyl-accepting chemotaxis protein
MNRVDEFLGRFRLRTKFGFMLAVPLLALIVFSAIQIRAGVQTAGELDDLTELSDLAVTVSAFVHEAQKERGASGLFMGSGGTNFADKLADQRALTEERRADLTAFLASFEGAAFGPVFADSLAEAQGFVDQLDGHRANVDALSIPNSEGIGFYTRMNAAQLNVIAHITELSDNAELSRLVSGYVNFLQGKERAGQERAVMSTVFATGHFEGNFFNRFAQLVTEQNTYQRVFESFATPDQIVFFESTVVGGDVDAVEEMRTVAFAGATAADLGVDGGVWFDAITAKINLLKEVENQLSADLVTKATDLRDSAQSSLIQLAVIVVTMVALTVAGAWVVARALSSQINALAGGLHAMAGGVTNHQVELEAEDEIGEMAASYRALQSYLSEMAGTARRIAEGDLSGEVTPRSEHDELGVAFRQMSSRLDEALSEVSETATRLDHSRTELGRVAEEATRSTQEVANSTTQVAQGTSDQANRVQETTGSISELTGSIDQVNEGAARQSGAIEQVTSLASGVAEVAAQVSNSGEQAAEAAARAVSTAADGAEKVTGTIAGMERIKEKVGAASHEIASLGERSAEIGKIVATIDDIAAQTNLLALNAAIEAARAGEQGRGFAVVADEVRQLAERVTSSTQEIANLIDGVQQGVEASVLAMDQGAEETEAGTRAAADAGESIDGIIAAVDAVTDQIGEIAEKASELGSSGTEMAGQIEQIREIAETNASAAAEMSESANAVSDSVTSIAATSEENSAATQQVSATAGEMTAQVEQITTSTQQLGEMSESLRKRMAGFQLSRSTGQLTVVRSEADEESAA